MKIAIIGTGHIGGTLAKRFSKLGHEVFIANSRGPESLKDLAAETGARAVSVKAAAESGEMVVVTIPLKNIPDLPADLFQGVSGAVAVVDTCNYYPQQRDGRIAEIEEGKTESQWVQEHLKHPVIKAFNNIYAQHLLESGQPAGAPNRIALPVAGDDDQAKALVMRMVEELGFDAVDGGVLSESWRQQPGSPVYAKDFDAGKLTQALTEATPKRKPEWKAKSDGDETAA